MYDETGHVRIYLPVKPEGVELIGREVVDAAHYPLVKVGSRYVLWEFQAWPDKMTVEGRVNAS